MPFDRVVILLVEINLLERFDPNPQTREVN